MNKLTGSTICMLLAGFINASAQIVLHGKVIDNESGEEIPYASIQIVNSAYGTACDDKGAFILKIDPEFYEDTLKVSCIGYSNSILAIQYLIDDQNEEFIISLYPFTEYLDDVVITRSRESPETLLEEAFEAIPENYIQQPFNMEAYSRMSIQDSVRCVLYQIESVLLTYSEGYISGPKHYSKFLQRRETGTIPSSIFAENTPDEQYFPYSPGLDIFISDQVGLKEFKYTVFDPGNFKRMKFKYAGVSIFDQDTVIAIEYSRKNSEFKGIIYIATNNLAIIKHAMRGISIIYKNVNGYYFPYTIKIKSPFINNEGIYYVDEISIKNIETENVAPLEKKFDQWYPKGVPYNEDYWKTNYPVKK